LVHKFNWERIASIGVIACKPDASERELLLQFKEGSVNKEDMVPFLAALKEHFTGKKVVLLWDGLPAHRSTLAQDYIAAESQWLTVEPMPGYAPELNPLEYLWSSIKTKHVGNLCPDNIDILQSRLEIAGTEIGGNPDLLMGFLKASGLLGEGQDR
jgi:transposase